MYLEQLLLVGVLGGAVLSLVGVGFTLVIGVGKVANFAHGAFVAVGMYRGYWIGHTLGLNPYVLFVPALLGFTIVGWGIAELFEWRGRKVGAVGELLVGLALLLLINGLLAVRFGTNPVTLNNFEMGSVSLAGTRIPGSEIYAAGFTLVVGVGIYLFLRGSRWGRALRAVAENPQSAALYGIRVPVAQRVAVTGSIALPGVGGLGISPFSLLPACPGTHFPI